MKRIAKHVPSALFVAGVATAAVGVGLIYLPAGLIVAGSALAAIGWLSDGGE